MELTLEQEFSIHAFADRIQNFNEDQLRDLLVKFYTYDLLKDKAYQDLIKHKWGIGEPSGEQAKESLSTYNEEGWDFLLF
jgi:hypothetical protein